ncbi:hypothetical protein CR513_56461, partial [Mucuna pruriens]
MVLRAAPTRMVSEYSPNRDGAAGGAPFVRAGVVSFDDDGGDRDEPDDGEGVVAAERGEAVGVMANGDRAGGDVVIDAGEVAGGNWVLELGHGERECLEHKVAEMLGNGCLEVLECKVAEMLGKESLEVLECREVGRQGKEFLVVLAHKVVEKMEMGLLEQRVGKELLEEYKLEKVFLEELEHGVDDYKGKELLEDYKQEK